MSIQFHGQTYWLQVQMGEGGVNQFQSDVKRLLDLNSEDDFDITFECQVPGEGMCEPSGAKCRSCARTALMTFQLLAYAADSVLIRDLIL
jgi:hypothetical protein